MSAKKPKTAMNQLSTPEELERLRKQAATEDESFVSVGGLAHKIEEAERRWDVFIYNIETREIVSEAGDNLRESGSFHTVGKRIETVMSRINDAYSVDAVPAGKYKKGDTLPKDVETYQG